MKNTPKPERITEWTGLLLRLVIGWHFLYEGLSKLLNPDWTSAEYLRYSRWIFADFFRWIVSNPPILRLVDWLNMWGLILIGLGLTALTLGLGRTRAVFRRAGGSGSQMDPKEQEQNRTEQIP